MDIDGQVLSVQGHQTQRGSMRYAVAFSDGNEYSTFENDLAKMAMGLKGQPVSIRVGIQQKQGNNGQTYTNRYLNVIAPQGQLPPEDMQDQAGQTVDGIPIAAPSGGGRRGGGGFKGMSEADKTRISKLGAIGDAFAFVGCLVEGAGLDALADAEAAAFALAGRIYNKAREHEINSTPQVTTNATPQQIAAAVPGVQVGTTPTEAPGEAEAAAATAPTPQW